MSIIETTITFLMLLALWTKFFWAISAVERYKKNSFLFVHPSLFPWYYIGETSYKAWRKRCKK